MLSQQTACLVIHDKPGRRSANERSCTACPGAVDVVKFRVFCVLFLFYVLCVFFFKWIILMSNCKFFFFDVISTTRNKTTIHNKINQLKPKHFSHKKKTPKFLRHITENVSLV